jgi:molybdopterin-guanine dinucleotide biosynthesis protein A
MSNFAAVVLSGGAGRRMGGVDKSALTVGGHSMRDRVLAAAVAAGAAPCVVVGPADALPPGVDAIREEPPGGGPVAAVAAGLTLVPEGGLVAVLAADLPLLTPAAVTALQHAVASADGALFVDDTGRRQLLCGVWRTDPLRRVLSVLGNPAGASMRTLVSGLEVNEVAWVAIGAPPWFDCDTDDDVQQARRWADEEETR